jgi:hypothetical protein
MITNSRHQVPVHGKNLSIEILTRTSSLKLKNMIGMVGSNEYSFSRSGSSCVLEMIAMYIFVPGTGSTVPPTGKNVYRLC